MNITKALYMVKDEAAKAADYHAGQIGKKPNVGSGDQRTHDVYHREHEIAARTVYHWCFVRLMQINPD